MSQSLIIRKKKNKYEAILILKSDSAERTLSELNLCALSKESRDFLFLIGDMISIYAGLPSPIKEKLIKKKYNSINELLIDVSKNFHINGYYIFDEEENRWRFFEVSSFLKKKFYDDYDLFRITEAELAELFLYSANDLSLKESFIDRLRDLIELKKEEIISKFLDLKIPTREEFEINLLNYIKYRAKKSDKISLFENFIYKFSILLKENQIYEIIKDDKELLKLYSCLESNKEKKKVIR